MTALMVSRIAVRDREKLTDYLARVQGVARRFGAEMVFRGTPGQVLNGQLAQHDMLVVVRFPSAEAVAACLADPDYLALVETREESAAMEMVAYQPLAA